MASVPAGVYNSAVLTRCIRVPMRYVASGLQEYIGRLLGDNLDGKCAAEGFIHPGSVKVISHSSGRVTGDNIEFQAVFECMIANPVEGQHIACVVQNVTKAGIKCTVDLELSPLVVFVARDHHFMDSYFSSISEGDHVVIDVIGQRYELNDPYISVIASLVETKSLHEHKKSSKAKAKRQQPKPSITIQENA